MIIIFNNIFKHEIDNLDENINIVGLCKEVQASYVWNLFCVTKKSIIVVINTLYEATNLYKNLSIFDANSILFFPMDDFISSEALAISPDLMSKRIETLNELTMLKDNDKKIIITNLMGYLRFLPTKNLWKSSKIKLEQKKEYDRDKLIEKLVMCGYQKESIVTKTGEYANRGYILDIFPYGYENPVRIEFFDNEIDEIREFNCENQLSISNLNEIDILPFSEFINEKKLEIVDKRQSILPLCVNEISSLSSYINNYYTVYIDLETLKIAYKNILEQTVEFKKNDDYKIEKYMNEIDDLIPKKYINIFSSDNYVSSFVSNFEKYNSKSLEQMNGNFELINNFLLKKIKENKKIIVCLESNLMISDFLSKIKYNAIITNYDKLYNGSVNILNFKMSNGFEINDYVFLTSFEIYNKKKDISYKNKFRYGSKIGDINKLNVGDYIVHSSFGIGKYLGIVTLTTKGLKKDYLHIKYRDDDKLYIPVEKIEYINKYSSKEGIAPKLSKLGGTDWIRQKARVKGKVKEIAGQLLKTSAKRKLIKGFAFFPDDKDQYEFENNFEYQETKDQLRAINEIKKDMEEEYPMDRLLCGDVGFGKTEVALRAIFKAIKSGKQVAFLCPTTILSKQHYQTALERFNGFGVNIEVLNRFTPLKQEKNIIENIKNGKIDLIIGTHKLLNEKIVYKDLGLLVIDEEQRFGVTHKEKLKQYKANVDILTLSATPIPRTLQMSLSGVRGLSLIETPPAYRYPVQTYVLRENDFIIKEAIYKELSRNGQIFILYNNIEKLDEQMVKIKKLVPEAKIGCVHGRLQKNQIETTMEQFVNGDFDILLCTTIIETGIDIQNANTLIIFDADHFGLSQLYQIRGRIGRGKNIAYAYLMYKKNKELNEIAVKRLNAIKEFTELGSGYHLAVRDLSIRGAGDILGAEQSGFIDSVGYDMYLKILNEEIESLKNNAEIKEDEKALEKPFIQVETHISDMYADNEELKIEIHKLINSIDNEQKLEHVKAELKDRFGKIDETLVIYMMEELFQKSAPEKGIIKVDQLKDNVILYFSILKSEELSASYLMPKLFQITSNFTLSYSGKMLKIALNIKNLEKHFLYYLIKLLDIIE